MGIAGDIKRVAAEFIPGDALFEAVKRQEGVTDYQTASWFMRHIEELDDLPMYAFDRATWDFYVVEVPWTSQVLWRHIYPKPGEDVSKLVDSGNWVDSERDFKAGWIRSDLAKFFKGKSVVLPNFGADPDPSDAPIADSSKEMSLLVHELATPDTEKELDTKERTTLLCIIGVIAREAKYDIARPSKAATAIVDAAAAVGITLGQRTVENWLKRVPEALDRRTT